MGTLITRRAFLKGGVVLVMAAGLVRMGVDLTPAAAAGGFRVNAATNITMATRPGAAFTIIDVGNTLWRLPQNGERAHRLTDDLEDATWPSLSPDGRRVVFQSFRHGTYDVCALDLGKETICRLTTGPEDDQDPSISPNGEHIAFVSDTGGASAVWCIGISGNDRRMIIGENDDRSYHSPCWHPDGGRLAYVAGDTRIESYDTATGTTTTLRTVENGHTVRGLSYSPTGGLIYVVSRVPHAWLEHDGQRLTDPETEEPAPLPASWTSDMNFIYSADGEIRLRTIDRDSAATTVPFSASLTPPIAPAEITSPIDLEPSERALGLTGSALSPDGKSICFRALNALWVSDFDGTAMTLTDDGYFNADPSWTPDGNSIIHSSDRSGITNLWRYDLEQNTSERLTFERNGAMMPAVSPDGKFVAFHDEAGGTHRLDLTTGDVTELLPPSDTPGAITWSPSSTMIAMSVHTPASERTDSGINEVLVLNVDSGESFTQPFAPSLSIATRNHDGPVWSADGKHLFAILESRVHRVAIDESGRITSDPTVVSDRVADGLSASTSGELAFVSLGEFVLLKAATRIQPTIEYTRRNPPGQFVLRAGRLWDGVEDSYRRDVDVLMQGGTIADIRPADHTVPADLDASTHTVIPGFIDVHNHWHMRGRAWGNRQGPAWLSYGVTTSRSAGDFAYEMRETREALYCGKAAGPRFLGSGEPLDGNRCSFGFMRCVTSPDQLARELERIVTLGYNCVKSYQRLPVELERQLVADLASHGIPVISHYVYPAVASGLHGMEHTGGGNRLGYSRTLSAAKGRTASDTISLLAAADFWVSSTLLFAAEVHAESSDLVDDERTKVLFPWWDYRRLKEKAHLAATDPDPMNIAWTIGDVDLLRSVQEAGGLVLLGTDAPLDDPGISIHTNLRAMVTHGFTPLEALRTGTVNAAKALGASGRLGQLISGAHADMLVVDGDPLAHIADASKIRDVFVDGVHTTIPELLDPYRDCPDEPGSVALTKIQQTCCRRRK